MSTKDKRFSRENIDRLLYDPTDTEFIRIFKEYVIVAILDFLPIYALFVWTDLYLIFKFSMSLFLALAVVLIIWSLYWLYLVFIKYYKIKANDYKFKFADVKTPFKFLLITDIHIGKRYYGTNLKRLRKIIKKVNDLNYDVVVLDGDFICDKIEKDMLMELKNIKAKHKLAVYGNHDCDYLGDTRHEKDPVEVIEIIEACDFKVLINEVELIEQNGEKVYFGGIPDLYTRRFDVNKAFESAPKGVPKVLLSHNPDIIDFIEDSDDIDLILSGHNHSGMIYFKPFDAHLPLPSKHKWLTQGVFNVGKRTKLFLSQGAGHSLTRLRIGTESEIAIIELQ